MTNFFSRITRLFSKGSSSAVASKIKDVKTSCTGTATAKVGPANCFVNIPKAEEHKTAIIEEQVPAETQNQILGAQSLYSNVCVCLDPGHAVTTNGKKSPYTLKKVSSPELPFEEWRFNRIIVDNIKTKLKSMGIDVYVTTDTSRDGVNDVLLSTRAQRANDYVKSTGKKGVFVSVHANAHGDGSKWTDAKGWSIYTTKGQNESDNFATVMYKEAEKILTPYGISMRKDMSDGDPDWEENFTVIVKANMPAVLTENLFYTNIKDLTFLNSDEGMKAIADIHIQGILAYLKTLE